MNAAGAEIGEKAFYKLVLKNASIPTEALLAKLESDLKNHAGETPFPGDITILSIAKDA